MPADVNAQFQQLRRPFPFITRISWPPLAEIFQISSVRKVLEKYTKPSADSTGLTPPFFVNCTGAPPDGYGAFHTWVASLPRFDEKYNHFPSLEKFGSVLSASGIVGKICGTPPGTSTK